MLRRFVRRRSAVAGLLAVLLLALIALAGPALVGWPYATVDRGHYLQPPSTRHLFGTTQAGRDMLALTLRGLRRSLLIGLLAAVACSGIAALVGSLAAYAGGWPERIMLWITDLLLVVPSSLLIAVVSDRSATGAASWLLLVALLAGFGWMLSARVIRGLALSVVQREYVLAAKFMGRRAPAVIVRHVLPNISALLIIDATLNVGGAILAESALSFFGFGVQSPDTSLGSLLADGARQATSFPWLFAGPATALVALVLSVNAVGDGLRHALDPGSDRVAR